MTRLTESIKESSTFPGDCPGGLRARRWQNRNPQSSWSTLVHRAGCHADPNQPQVNRRKARMRAVTPGGQWMELFAGSPGVRV